MPKSPAPDDPRKPDRPMPPPAYRSGCVPAPAAAAHRAPQPAVFPAPANPRTIARQPSSALLRIQCQRITAKRPWQMLVDKCFSPSEVRALLASLEGWMEGRACGSSFEARKERAPQDYVCEDVNSATDCAGGSRP